MTDNFIEVYNALTPKECEKLIDAFKLAEKAELTTNRQQSEKASKLNKDDQHCFYPSWEFPIAHTSVEVSKIINKGLWQHAYKEYASKYGILGEIGNHSSYEVKLQKTNPGEGYHLWHCEAGDRSVANRLLTWTAYLNDDFEGGETEFLYQHYRYKPRQGDIVMFPAAFTHTHRGNPPLTNTKYIATGWIEF